MIIDAIICYFRKSFGYLHKIKSTMDRIGIFCSSSNRMDSIYYKEAERLGTWMGLNKKTLVYGGANCGLMETLAKAVHENGGTVLGVIPKILVERDRVSDYIDIHFHCEDLTDRKVFLENESEVIIVLPGSIGTLDEMFTVMASNTIGIHNKKVILWNINGFWDGLLQFFNGLLEKNVVNKPFEDMFVCVNTFEEVVKAINRQE